MVMTQPTRQFSLIPIVILLALSILALMVVETATSHAETKHGDVAPIRQCLDNGGELQRWYNAELQHIIQMCQVDGRYCLRVLKYIDGSYREITCFKTKYTLLEKVMRYLTNSGADRVY